MMIAGQKLTEFGKRGTQNHPSNKNLRFGHNGDRILEIEAADSVTLHERAVWCSTTTKKVLVDRREESYSIAATKVHPVREIRHLDLAKTSPTHTLRRYHSSVQTRADGR